MTAVTWRKSVIERNTWTAAAGTAVLIAGKAADGTWTAQLRFPGHPVLEDAGSCAGFATRLKAQAYAELMLREAS